MKTLMTAAKIKIRLLSTKSMFEHMAVDAWREYKKSKGDPLSFSRSGYHSAWLAYSSAAISIACDLDLACWSFERDTAERCRNEVRAHPEWLECYREAHPLFNFQESV